MSKKTTTRKKYIPNSKEKYMCAKHKKFFTDELLNWKKDIIKAKEVSKKVLNKESKIFITSLDKTMKLVSKGTFSVPMERSHPLNNYIPHVKAKINVKKEKNRTLCRYFF